MKKWLFKIVAWGLIAIGAYGLVGCGIFLNKHVFARSKEETNKRYVRYVKPEINERLSKLRVDDLTEAQKTNLQQIVKQSVYDHDITMDMVERGGCFLFSFVLSLFSILLGFILLIWKRLNDLSEAAKQK
jgi:hypothetical protein